MEDNIYDLKKAWNEMANNHLVQSVSLNPELAETSDEDPGFDYLGAHHKLNKIFKNVGSSAQSAEFGGNDVWLILGKYPLRTPGESATFLFAGDDTYKNRDGFYDIFKRTLNQSGEYEDETIDSGDYEPILAKAINMRPMKEADTPEEAIARRERDEAPANTVKTIKLDGSIADLLDREMRETGNNEWTDGFQGNGPYLPKEVETYVMKVAGNATEEPFKVRFIKYGSSSPLEGRGASLYIEYEQETSPSNEFGNRDMDESATKSPIDTLKNLVRVEDLEDQIFIYFGIIKIGHLEQIEDGSWDVFINNKPLSNSYATKEEALAKFVEYMSE